MLAPWIVILGLLALGEVAFGHVQTINLLQIARDETIIALDRIAANRYFQFLRNALIVSILLPITFGPWAVLSSRTWWMGGITGGRILIVVGFLLSVLILLAVWKVSDLLARAIIVIFPSRSLENLRDGIEGSVKMIAAWQVFVGYLLFTFGIYGSLYAITAALFAFVGYILVTQAYHKPTRLFPRLALLVFICGMVFHALQWVPSSVWLAVGSEDLRPKLNFHSGLDFFSVESAEAARWERERELCREEIASIEKKFENATRDQFKVLSDQLDRKKKECAM